jgi:hypothetical protein
MKLSGINQVRTIIIPFSTHSAALNGALDGWLALASCFCSLAQGVRHRGPDRFMTGNVKRLRVTCTHVNAFAVFPA